MRKKVYASGGPLAQSAERGANNAKVMGFHHHTDQYCTYFAFFPAC